MVHSRQLTLEDNNRATKAHQKILRAKISLHINISYLEFDHININPAHNKNIKSATVAVMYTQVPPGG